MCLTLQLSVYYYIVYIYIYELFVSSVANVKTNDFFFFFANV